jgi:hypothetical protein
MKHMDEANHYPRPSAPSVAIHMELALLLQKPGLQGQNNLDDKEAWVKDESQ